MLKDEQVEQEFLYSHADRIEESSRSQDTVPQMDTIFGKELESGTKVGAYRVVRKLGAGGFGITYLAKDTLLERLVVLKENFPMHCAYRDPLTGKVVPNNDYDKAQFDWALSSFVNEAKIIANIDHPGVVRILEIFHSNSTAYFAMEYVEGVCLEYLVSQVREGTRSLSESQLVYLLKCLLDITDEIHSYHVCHKDIKPANILINRDGMPILIDFGAARNFQTNQTTTVVTSEGFSSPEQALGLKQIGDWSDIYSLAATFFYVIKGRPPIRAEGRIISDTEISLATDPELVSKYSSLLLSSIDKAMAPRIDQRYRTSEQWLETLDKISIGEPLILTITPEDLLAVGYHVSSTSSGTSSTTRRRLSQSRRQKLHLWKLMTLSAVASLLLCWGAFLLWEDEDEIPPVEEIPLLTAETQESDLESCDLNQVPVTRYVFPIDLQREQGLVSSFIIDLQNPFIAGEFDGDKNPEKVNLTSVYITKAPDEEHCDPNRVGHPLYLEIWDGEKRLARADDYIPINIIISDISFSYSFRTPVTLETKKKYTARFVDAQGKEEKASIYVLSTDHPSESTMEASASYYCVNTPKQTSPLLSTPEAQEMTKLCAEMTPYTGLKYRSLIAKKGSFPVIKALADEGYSWASLIVSDKYRLGVDVPKNERLSYIWCYRAAVQGCILAQERFAAYHCATYRFFKNRDLLPKGVRRDEMLAHRLYQYAGQRNYPPALLLMGLYYTQGWGVPRFVDRALRIFNVLSGCDNTGEFCTEALKSEHVDLIGIWQPQYLTSREASLFKASLSMLWSDHRMRGIYLHGFNQSGKCIIRNIRLTHNGREIKRIDQEFIVEGVSKSPMIPLALDEEYAKIPRDQLFVEMDIKSVTASYGAVEVITESADVASGGDASKVLDE